MALVVVNYPTLAEEDFGWIQTIREVHDRLYYHVVDPHFTLVFPTDGLTSDNLLSHVQEHADSFEPFEFVLRCVILGDADFEGHAHAFLVPDEGFSNIVKLHDRLYTGPLRGEQRLDLPFIPHIGIANAPKLESCKETVDTLNAKGFEIRGRVESVNVIGYDGRKVWDIERVKLGR